MKKVIPLSQTISSSSKLLPISTLLAQNAPKLKSIFSSQEGPPPTTNQHKLRQHLQVLPYSVWRTLPKSFQRKQQVHQHQASTKISTGGLEGSSTPRTEEQTIRSSSSAAAAILVPLIDTGGGDSASYSDCNNLDRISILFTKRSNHLKEHANEISFPGGHLDHSLDGHCLIQTAIRETREELLSPLSEQSESNSTASSHKFQYEYDFDNDLIIIGQTETIPSAKLVPVTPFVAYFKHKIIPCDIQTLFPGNRSEVAQVFSLTVSQLLQMEDTMYLKRLNMDGPVYRSDYGDIWGLTALVLKPILDQVLKPVFSND